MSAWQAIAWAMLGVAGVELLQCAVAVRHSALAVGAGAPLVLEQVVRLFQPSLRGPGDGS
jgi:hypothetical protein